MLIFQVLKPPKTFIKEELRFIYSAGSDMVNVKDCLLSGQEQACSRITRLCGCSGVPLSPSQKWSHTQEMAVDCAFVITSIGKKPFPDQTRTYHTRPSP